MYVQVRVQKGWIYYSIHWRYRNKEGRVISKMIYLGSDPVITRKKVIEYDLDPQEVAKLIIGTIRTHEGNREILLPVVEQWDLQTLKQCDAVWEMREWAFKEAAAWFNLAILLPLPQFENLALVHQAACEAAELAFDKVRAETQSLDGGPGFLRELYVAALRICADFVEHPPPLPQPAPSPLDPRFWELVRAQSCDPRILFIMSKFKCKLGMMEPQIELARRVHNEHQAICPACMAEKKGRYGTRP